MNKRRKRYRDQREMALNAFRTHRQRAVSDNAMAVFQRLQETQKALDEAIQAFDHLLGSIDV